MTFQGKSAAHLSAVFGARAAVYCVAALVFVGSVRSLVRLYRLFLLGVFDSYLSPWQAWLLVYPGLLIAMAVGLVLLKRWAWVFAIAFYLINGIVGLVILWLRPKEMPWVAVLNTPSRVVWWVVYTVVDLGVVVVLLLKPVRALFFRRPQPPAAALNRSDV